MNDYETIFTIAEDACTTRWSFFRSSPQGEGKDGLYSVETFVEKPAPEDAPSDLAIGRYLLTPEIFGILESKPGAGNETN